MPQVVAEQKKVNQHSGGGVKISKCTWRVQWPFGGSLVRHANSATPVLNCHLVSCALASSASTVSCSVSFSESGSQSTNDECLARLVSGTIAENTTALTASSKKDDIKYA